MIKELTTPQKKAAFHRLVQAGVPRTKAADEVGVTLQAVSYWRRQDADFRAADDRLRSVRLEIESSARTDMPSFEEFCRKYLDTELFNHHLQWVDCLEGREPRNLHPNQVYIKGEPEFLLINTPPEHAKSTTITMNYVTYRICEDPNIRIILVSQTQEMAKKFLRGIKDRLSSPNPNYRKLQIDFAPDGGFAANAASWTADSIYVSSDLRDSGEKDPTVQALSIGGHIYGSRADLIILDDCVTGKNAHEYEKQMDWLQREVYNRLSYPGGVCLLVGTRLAPVDLYGEIVKDEYYGEEESPWTYLTQPAVLEFDEDPKKWKTLWPFTNRAPVSKVGKALVEQDETTGLYPMWTGPALKKRRASMSPRNWALVYMQEQVVDDAIFPEKAVLGSVDAARQPGPMPPGTAQGRPRGLEGCYVVGGFDPAVTGNSAAVVVAMDRSTGIRWVLDVWTRPTKPDDIFDKIKEWTVKYKMNEWRIEKNAMNLMVTQNREIRSFLASRGCLLREHFTGSNKWDADFGVASMSMLFDGWESKKQLIRLPNKQAEGVKALISQLVTWEPEEPHKRSRRKTDCVMALWFAEIRCRELVDETTKQEEYHYFNPYASERDKSRQAVVDLDYMSQAAMHGDSTMSWWSG